VENLQLYADVRYQPDVPDAQVGNTGTFNPYLGLKWNNPDPYSGGELWSDVKKHGYGIYAHIEQINEPGQPLSANDLYNMEYFILYPFNRGLTKTLCEIGDIVGNHEFADHDGDLDPAVTLVTANPSTKSSALPIQSMAKLSWFTIS
jgi:hypothetical protein